MTEEKAEYKVTPELGEIRHSCFLPYDQRWTLPEPGEVRELIKRLEMSGAEVADFVGVSSARSVRHRQAGPGQPNAREIPYAAWRLLSERYLRKLAGEQVVLYVAEGIQNTAEMFTELNSIPSHHG